MKQKTKILHIVEAFGGGVFSFFVDLINNTSEDFEIVIAYSVRNQTPEDFKKYFKRDVKFIEVKNFTRSVNPIKDLKAFFELKKIIKKEMPNIIHLHSSKAGFLGRFAANGKKVKMLYNPHGFSFLMQNTSKLKRFIYLIAEKIGALRKCTIIGCSKGEYEEALKLTKNAICINNGVDIINMNEEVKELTKKEIDFNNLKICTSGRIGYQKNPKLFNDIAMAFPNIQFTWIGDGELRNELTSSNINITGWKERDEVLKLVNENDIFILTSLWEGLPISLLEAMFLNKVCMVSNCIGNRDVIKTGKNGFVCNDKSDFEKAIKNLKNMDYQSIKDNALKDIEEIFNTDTMINEYEKVYRQ